MGLPMPNSDITVMNSPTCADAHAQYVYTEQIKLSVDGATTRYKEFKEQALDDLLDDLENENTPPRESEENWAAYGKRFLGTTTPANYTEIEELTKIQDLVDPNSEAYIAASTAAALAAKNAGKRKIRKKKNTK
jgi:hypothetical protein